MGLPGLSNKQTLMDISAWDHIHYGSLMMQHDVEDRYVDWVKETFLNDHDPRGILMSNQVDMGPFVVMYDFPVEPLDENSAHHFILRGQHFTLDDGDIVDLFNCLYHVTVENNEWFLDHIEHDRHGNPL